MSISIDRRSPVRSHKNRDFVRSRKRKRRFVTSSLVLAFSLFNSWFVDVGNHDSATLQSMQWIINAAYIQCIIQSTPLYTAWINLQIWGAPECLPTFGARTFPTVITASVVWELIKKMLALIVWCVDYMFRCTYRSNTRIIVVSRPKILQ
jgi:hypothetical protein